MEGIIWLLDFALCLPDHPHIRGRNFKFILMLVFNHRIIPTFVGEYFGNIFFELTDRIIPIYMRGIIKGQIIRDLRAVHPHIRGRNAIYRISHIPVNGSSPHTWEEYHQGSFRHLDLRFIPTYVGGIQNPKPPLSFSSVHPHIRGRNYFRICIDL